MKESNRGQADDRAAKDFSHRQLMADLERGTREARRLGKIAAPRASSGRPASPRHQPAPSPVVSDAPNLHRRTEAARRETMQAAVRGEQGAIDHLRTDASWFSESTSNFNRSPYLKPATDAQIVAAARKALGLPAVASRGRTGVAISAADIYRRRAQAALSLADRENPPTVVPRTFADLARDAYGGRPSVSDGGLISSARGGAA